MSFKHGKNAKFTLDNNAGTPVDLSAFINNVDFSRDVDVPETTTFGNSDRVYINGLRGATISVSGFWDGASSAVDEVLEAILTGSNADTSKTFEYAPDNTTGEPQYSGECFMTSYATSSPVDGVTTFTFDLQITGAVTRGTAT